MQITKNKLNEMIKEAVDLKLNESTESDKLIKKLEDIASSKFINNLKSKRDKAKFKNFSSLMIGIILDEINT